MIINIDLNDPMMIAVYYVVGFAFVPILAALVAVASNDVSTLVFILLNLLPLLFIVILVVSGVFYLQRFNKRSGGK